VKSFTENLKKYKFKRLLNILPERTLNIEIGHCSLKGWA